MAEYTPTTDEIQNAWEWRSQQESERAYEHLLGGFDRWLAEHDRTVKAEALREAADLRHGTDLTPTVMGNPDPIWWYGYLQRVDDSWRHQLRARADQIEGVTE